MKPLMAPQALRSISRYRLATRNTCRFGKFSTYSALKRHFSHSARLGRIPGGEEKADSASGWQAQNNYSRMPWSDTAADEGSERDGDSVSVNKDGYKPLTRPLEIRVLILHPGEKGSPIKCSLQHGSLRSKELGFEALSYVWGIPTPANDIVCDNRKRKVGRNLYNALERLRLPDTDRVLWIDALCINQGDNKEKTQQVRIMGEIYTRARRVLIWLGNGDDVQKGVGLLTSKPANEKHADWSPLRPVFTNPLFIQAQSLLIWLGFEGAVNMGVAKLEKPQSPTKFDWSLLIPVVQSPWFTRVWCIQELVLASNPMIVTRDSMISWDKFARAVLELRRQFNTYRMKTSHQGNESIENFYFLHDMREKHKMRRKKRHSLLELLFLTRGFQATDPRDKLFALIGLAGDVLSSDWEVTPNYDLSVAEVYRRFALWHLTRKRQFEVFSFGCNQDLPLSPQLESLPSWVPDLTRPDFTAPLPKLEYLSTNYIDLRYEVLKEFELRKKYFHEGIKIYHADLKYPWWALGRRSDFRPAQIAFSNGTAVIHVVGTKIGSLQALGTPFSQDAAVDVSELLQKTPEETDAGALRFSSNVLNTYEWLNEAWALVGETALGDKHARLTRNMIDGVWRTVTCCMTPKGENAQFTIYSRAAQSLYENFLDRAHRLEATSGAYPGNAGFNTTSFTEDELHKLLLIHISVIKWHQGRRFAITDSGDFAAVPKAARKGDVVCIFNGGRVPYVLRPCRNGHYTLVGECYVDGMMRGEVRDRFARKAHETSFSIE
ncbi:heterokaryon incompatibility domain-containing protein [Trichoderma austrokoningii]